MQSIMGHTDTQRVQPGKEREASQIVAKKRGKRIDNRRREGGTEAGGKGGRSLPGFWDTLTCIRCSLERRGKLVK
jgi:hypothetical protein